MDNLWTVLLTEFSRRVQKPKYVIQCLAIYPIVKLAAEGCSNFRISKRLDLPIKYVESVLINFLSVTGWEADLDFSPLAVYNRAAGVFDEYCRQVVQISAVDRSESILILSYNMCKLYKRMQQELDKYGRD